MHLPLTIRVFYHGLRSVAQAIAITLLGWVIFVPATEKERAALGVTNDNTRPYGLAEMRIAQVMMDFAPQRFARLVSMASNGELSPDFAELIMRKIASGDVPQPAQTAQQPADPAGRGPNGSKFVTINRD